VRSNASRRTADTMTLATSVVAGYGIGLTGFAIMVDVVTP
jgi:hypothetical protein